MVDVIVPNFQTHQKKKTTKKKTNFTIIIITKKALFLEKPVGLLALLDEESHFPQATDTSLRKLLIDVWIWVLIDLRV